MKPTHWVVGAVVVCAVFSVSRFVSPPKETKTTRSASAQPQRAVRPSPRSVHEAVTARPRVADAQVTAVETSPELDALRAGLRAPRVADRIAAIDAAREQGLTAALPDLQSVAVEQDAWVGRAAIDAIASIAKLATPAEAQAAAERLSSWLESELSRIDAELAAPGNVVQLVEALGQVPAPAASTAVRRLLSDGDLPRYLQVLTARQLESTRDPAAARELRDFKARAESWVATDNGEREEVAQALAAADAALAAIQP